MAGAVLCHSMMPLSFSLTPVWRALHCGFWAAAGVVPASAWRFLKVSLPALFLLVANPVAAEEPVRIVMLGDSLVAGFGLESGEGLVPQLGAWLDARGESVDLVNAGVSGDTTAAGRMRLDWSVGPDAEAVVLALGANDMLRGLPPAQTRANLAAMVEALQARGLPVLLVGMRASGNLGPGYVEEFDSIYPDLARAYGVPLQPFLLEGVALNPGLNQADGIHPNAEGTAVVAEGLGPYVAALAREARGRR